MTRKTTSVIGICAALLFSAGLSSAVLADNATGSAKAPSTGGSTKPNLGNGPADEKSLPSSAPSATTTQSTGASDQSKGVKSMNSNEKAKVETGGK